MIDLDGQHGQRARSFREWAVARGDVRGVHTWYAHESDTPQIESDTQQNCRDGMLRVLLQYKPGGWQAIRKAGSIEDRQDETTRNATSQQIAMEVCVHTCWNDAHQRIIPAIQGTNGEGESATKNILLMHV
jgi:hypothetical protein